MFSKRPNKKQIRREHEQKIADFLAQGGTIKCVPPGATGLIDGRYHTRHIRIERTHETRTPIPEVVAAIEARRPGKKTSKTTAKPKHQSYRKVVYDDFGEPVRVIWSHK